MTKPLSYTPAQGSLAERVCKHFKAAPDDEVSTSDIAAMFDVVDIKNIHAKLENAVSSRLLVRQGAKYTAGADLASYNPDALPAPPAAAAAAARPAPAPDAARAENKRTWTRRHLPPLDFGAISIETGVPKPAAKQASAYSTLISKMKPGNSIVLPFNHAKRLIDWAHKIARRNGTPQKWSVRKLDGENARVWRDQ